MKSIAFLLRFWPYFGGGETVSRILAKEFLNRGYQVYVIYWWDRYEGRTYDDDDKLHKIKMDVPGPFGDSKTSQTCYHDVFNKLKEHINSQHIDILINQWWPSDIFEEKLNAKIISCHHTNVITNDNSRNPLKRLYHYLFKTKFVRKGLCHLDGLYEKSDYLVFLAESYKNEYNKYSAVYKPNKDTEFIYNPSTYSSQIENDWKSMKKKEILFVGRVYDNYKRLTLLLKVWNEVLKSGVKDWKLKIVGDGPDLQMVKEMSARMNLNHVEFLGAKDPREDYKTASLFVLTSRFEGWPMTIVEAQHYGTVPLVMNTFSALKELMSEDAGVIVDSEKPNKMASEIVRLMYDDKERIYIAKNAIRKSNEYHVSKVIDKWEKLFERL